MEEDPGARFLDEPLPGDLEVLGEIGHSGPGAVRVRSLDDRSEPAERFDHDVGDPADDLARRLPRSEEAVERVQDRRARSAEERQLLDEQDGCPRACRRDRGGRPSRTGPDDADVDVGEDLAGHPPGPPNEVTDQPPSTFRS